MLYVEEIVLKYGDVARLVGTNLLVHVLGQSEGDDTESVDPRKIKPTFHACFIWTPNGPAKFQSVNEEALSEVKRYLPPREFFNAGDRVVLRCIDESPVFTVNKTAMSQLVDLELFWVKDDKSVELVSIPFCALEHAP